MAKPRMATQDPEMFDLETDESESTAQSESDPLEDVQPPEPEPAPEPTPAAASEPEPTEIPEEEAEEEAVPETMEPQLAAEGEPPTETPPGDDLDILRQQNAALISQLEAVSQGALGYSPPQPVSPQQSQPAQAPPPQAMQQAPPDLVPFVSDEEFQGIFDSSQNLNQTLNRVYQTALQSVLVSTPQIVNSLVQHQFYVNRWFDEFYQQNEDLKPHTQYVVMLMNQTYSAHPDWSMDQIGKEAGAETRKRLSLRGGKQKAPQATQPVAPIPPAPRGSGSRRASGSSRTPDQREIDELIDLEE